MLGDLFGSLGDLTITHTRDAVVAVDLQGRTLCWNPAAERVFGIVREDVLGNVLSEVEEFFARTEHDQLFAQAVQGHEVSSESVPLWSRGWAQRISVEISYVPIKNCGDVVAVAMFIMPSRSAKETENALVDTEQKLIRIADAMPNLIWTSDGLGIRNFFNKRWLTFTGLSLEGSLNNRWFESMHPDDRHRYVQAQQAAIAEHKGFHVEY